MILFVYVLMLAMSLIYEVYAATRQALVSLPSQAASLTMWAVAGHVLTARLGVPALLNYLPAFVQGFNPSIEQCGMMGLGCEKIPLIPSMSSDSVFATLYKYGGNVVYMLGLVAFPKLAQIGRAFVLWK